MSRANAPPFPAYREGWNTVRSPAVVRVPAAWPRHTERPPGRRGADTHPHGPSSGPLSCRNSTRRARVLRHRTIDPFARQGAHGMPITILAASMRGRPRRLSLHGDQYRGSISSPLFIITAAAPCLSSTSDVSAYRRRVAADPGRRRRVGLLGFASLTRQSIIP